MKTNYNENMTSHDMCDSPFLLFYFPQYRSSFIHTLKPSAN